MARISMILTLLACGAIAACASRLPMEPDMSWTAVAQAVDRKSDAHAVTFKFFAPPGLTSDFVDHWDDYIGRRASKAKGNMMVNLHRPVISNAIHYDYSEWETMEDFVDFFKSNDAQDFRAYLNDKDIKWEMELLVKNTGTGMARPRPVLDASKNHHAFSVLTSIELKPHHAYNFISEWMNAEEETSHENSNMIYALHRVATSNDKYYLFGTWDSEQSWKDHLESKHVRKLANWADDHDIVFVESPLIEISKY